MNKNYVIGIDIGGTHTDAVLINSNQEIICKYKTATTSQLEKGVYTALQQILTESKVDKNTIQGLFIGTTHSTNAILENQNLYKVGVIRIAGHQPNSLRPCYGWPKEIKESIFAGCETINGGFECDGRQITPFDRNECRIAAEKLVEQGAESIAIVGVFSPIISQHEEECAASVREIFGPAFPISISSAIGGIGFIERENATILNCALKRPIVKGFQHLENVKDQLNLKCPLLVTQNDGSLINLNQAIDNPLLTISSGPTNSFIGASKLANVKNAIIIDIGGTSSDIGMILNGYPKRSMHNIKIGGINLNFRMPDVLALAIGGGSYVQINGFNQISIGPKSCGKDLINASQVFGGRHLTLTDAACKIGCMSIPKGDLSKISIDLTEGRKILQQFMEKVCYGIARMQGNRTDLPVVFVGGGAPIALSFSPQEMQFISPENADVANAFGAALAEISGTIDTVASLENREALLDKLKDDAHSLAVKQGAMPDKTEIVDVQIIPYHYMPKSLARIIVKASGPRKTS